MMKKLTPAKTCLATFDLKGTARRLCCRLTYPPCVPHHLNASNSFLTATLHTNTPVFISIMAWDTKTSRQNSGAVVPSTSAGPLTRAAPPPPTPFSSAGTPVENTRSAQITPPEPPQKATWLDVARQNPKLDMLRSHTHDYTDCAFLRALPCQSLHGPDPRPPNAYTNQPNPGRRCTCFAHAHCTCTVPTHEPRL